MLESHLALSLVYNAPPTHHLRALRSLEHLLATPPPPPSSAALAPRPHPDPFLLIAKAHVLQASEGKQVAALKVWDQVLALPAGALPPDVLTQARSERAWALHRAGQSDEARAQLEDVVAALEERKVRRDKEREEKEKWRSKRGLEKPEGVEEGEQPEEAEERAKAWWRLGECVWKLGGTFLLLSPFAPAAFAVSDAYSYRVVVQPDAAGLRRLHRRAARFSCLRPGLHIARRLLPLACHAGLGAIVQVLPEGVRARPVRGGRRALPRRGVCRARRVVPRRGHCPPCCRGQQGPRRHGRQGCRTPRVGLEGHRRE